MKNVLILFVMMLFTMKSWGVCSSPISRTNNTPNQVLTSTKYNLDLNTVYSKVNNLSGDCITDTSISTSKLVDESVTAEKIASDVLARFIPARTILAWGGTTAPDGYLLCNGQAVNRTTYADLYAVIGTSFGSGNGSTTFHLPDFRGRFLRGVDGGVGSDPDRLTRTAMNSGGNAGDAVGSVQQDAFEQHEHFTVNTSNVGGTVSSSNYVTYGNASGSNSFYLLSGSATVANAGLTNPVGGTETRPQNANVNYIIKY